MDETGQLPGMQAARLHLARYGPVIEVAAATTPSPPTARTTWACGTWPHLADQ